MKVWLDTPPDSSSSIELADKALASGGEAQLFAVTTTGYTQLIAKVYHPSKKTKLREDKLAYLIVNRPKSSHPDTKLIWPQQKIYDEKGAFIGFLMSYFEGEKLEILCLPRIPKKFCPTWNSYNFEEDSRTNKRLHICYLIASAMNDLHQLNNYVLVDFKPDNVVISLDGQIAFVDLDSIEVVSEGQTVFDAPVATPEYSPPDSYLDNPIVDPTQEDPWDRFSLGVILYKILLGIHPYAATPKAPYEYANNLYQKIELGLFVYHPEKQSFLSIIPAQHEKFRALDYRIQELFMRCFVAGHDRPFARPSAEEWTHALRYYNTNGSINRPDLPPLSLAFLPNKINLKQLYELPDFTLVSARPKLQVGQKISRKELQKKQISPEFIDPKELRAQRFFNFTASLIIVVVCAAISILIPWQFASFIAIAAYLSLNLMSYKNRKTAARKEYINKTLKHQMTYFNELIETAERYEDKQSTCRQKLGILTSKVAPDELKELLVAKKLLEQKIQNFEQAISLEEQKINDLKRRQKKAFKLIIEYYDRKTKELQHLPELEAKTLIQYLKQYKRAHRLNLLSKLELVSFDTNIEQLETLADQYIIEEKEWLYKGSERMKDIHYNGEQLHQSILEEVAVYNASISHESLVAVESLVRGYRINIREFERLSQDVERLQIPIQQQLDICQKTKIDAALYQKINFKNHVLNMLGIG